ncbi:hypothetical protein O3P69_020091 [Scylla paramamosain]|uniref:Uncharacterized protein n=1 Tax=Scylla paramamosain TaxID=85552 RepID=A0AAW0TNK4_SCYPA
MWGADSGVFICLQGDATPSILSRNVNKTRTHSVSVPPCDGFSTLMVCVQVCSKETRTLLEGLMVGPIVGGSDAIFRSE